MQSIEINTLVNTESPFVIQTYFDKIKINTISILSRPSQELLTFDFLDTEKSKKNKQIALKEKQRQMKIGEILQMCLGNYHTFEDLGIGHETGLDIISKSRKIIIELKTRTNTDNASAKKSNLDKLAKFKLANPDYECIYACVNDETESKFLRGENKIIMHNGVELKRYVGMEFLTYILGEHTGIIVKFIKDTIDENTV